MFTWVIGIVCSHLKYEENKVLNIISSNSRTQILVCLRAKPIFCPCYSVWWRWDSMNRSIGTVPAFTGPTWWGAVTVDWMNQPQPTQACPPWGQPTGPIWLSRKGGTSTVGGWPLHTEWTGLWSSTFVAFFMFHSTKKYESKGMWLTFPLCISILKTM